MHTLIASVAWALSLAVLTAGAVSADTAQTRAVDVAKSSAMFGVQHVFVERVTGTVPIVSGSVTLAAPSSIPINVKAVVDATKITTGDPDQTSALRNQDFFDTKRFPTWTFTSTAVTPHGSTAFGLDGMLTIHGVRQPEHLDVTVSGDAEHPIYHATGHIDRHAFGMAVTRLDPAIGGTVDVTLSIALTDR